MKTHILSAGLLLTCALSIHAQDAPAQRDAPAGPTISLAEHLQQITRIQALLAACRQSAPQCVPDSIPPDAQVQAADTTFQQRWQWLRDTLQRGRDPGLTDRDSLLDSATQRLTAESALATHPAPAPDVKQARIATTSILSHAEFRRVQHASYLQRQFALFGAFLDRLFRGVGSLIPQSPWFATLLEWALLAAAIIALILWAWRLNQQQRLAIVTHTAPAGAWQKESEDWSARAQHEAQQGNWREAVHCLYWSAIVLLEGQKLWRQNRARTPREYLPLLESGTPRRDALTALTRVFERIWYGLRPASPADYTQATDLLNRIKSA